MTIARIILASIFSIALVTDVTGLAGCRSALYRAGRGTPLSSALQVLCTRALAGSVAIAADAAATSPASLGDLTDYIAIAKDSRTIAHDGDLAKARLRIKELEKTWDAGEDLHRPLNPDAWTATDKLMDKAIGKLRASKPVAKVVLESLDDLIKALETYNKPK